MQNSALNVPAGAVQATLKFCHCPCVTGGVWSTPVQLLFTNHANTGGFTVAREAALKLIT